MVAKSIALPLFLLACLTLYAQKDRDSLERVLPSTIGRQRAEILVKLSWAYRLSDKDKALRFGTELYELAISMHDSTLIASALNSISETWLNFGDYQQAEKLTLEELQYLNPNIPNTNLLGALTRLGTIHYRQGKFEKALSFQLQVQRNADLIGKDDIMGVANVNLGLTYMDLKRYAEAQECFLTALQSFRDIGHSVGIGACYVNLTETLRNQKQYQLALDTARSAEQYLLASDNKIHAAYLYGSMGKIYYSLRQIPQSIASFKKGLAMATLTQDKFSIALNKIGLGRAYLESGDLAESKALLDTALYLAQIMHEKSILLEAYSHLRDWYTLQRDFDKAVMYDEQYQMGMDSVFNASMVEKATDAQTKYETEKKEAEIVRQKLTLLRQRSWIISLISGLLVFLGFAYLFYNRFRLRKKAELDEAVIREQRLGLNAVIEAQENERKRIAKDLHDGIAQELVALKLGFDSLGRRVSKIAPEETEYLQDLGNQLNASCIEVRNIAYLMSPPILDQKGLAPSLEMLLRNSLQPMGIYIHFEHQNVPVHLEDKVKIGFYRIAQELIQNVAKHAEATIVKMRLYMENKALVMYIEDNGKGFDMENARSKGSMGLLNILSRVSHLNGTFKVEPARPNGSIATVSVAHE